ncbi:MAG: hypothetical protein ABIW17_06465, partial [Marmoricola sp.]
CGEGYFADPTWTTDSTSIAYTELKYDFEVDPPPAGPHLALLGFPNSSKARYPNVVGDRDPDYSPTGKRLVFNHYSWIYTSDANGAHRKHLLKGGYHPDWQPVFG